MDLAIVLLSLMGITLEEIEISAALPINPTIIRIMRVLRIARGKYAVNNHIHVFLFLVFLFFWGGGLQLYFNITISAHILVQNVTIKL